MIYRSTRDNNETASFCEAVARALAPGGGLYYPDEFPTVQIEEEDFPSISAKVLQGFAGAYQNEFQAICQENYENFPLPVVKTASGNFLELFHGPSGAFKDVALTMLPKVAKLCGQEETVYVTATSGDTGKAALEAFKDIPGTSILVFYPAMGVAPLQELQMQTQAGDNVKVVAIEGNFDDAQRAAKKILSSGDPGISSCNSINIARLIAQVPYYFHAAQQMAIAEPVTFIVPSGNFGDILAGYYAKRMGLPVDQLVVATNSNTVLKDFFTTGVYDRKRDLVKTSSPSMDILVSSNLERLLCHIFGTEKTGEWMQQLEDVGHYEVPVEGLAGFQAYSATEEEVEAAIRTVYKDAGYVMDPHTACGWVAWDKMGRPQNAVILSTASPSKFPETIVHALTGESVGPKEALAVLETYTPLHPALENLYDLPIRFTECIPQEDAVQAFSDFRGGKK